ncbi:MAG: hypothetical protein [Microviridae sp.]|nr:MAG: hypothetical protein [Microviridae sp.]
MKKNVKILDNGPVKLYLYIMENKNNPVEGVKDTANQTRNTAIINGIKQEVEYFEKQINNGNYKPGQLSALVNKIARLKSLLAGYEGEK